MEKIIIEKGITPPSTNYYVGKNKRMMRSKYPWHDFEVGDSMFIPEETNKSRVANSLYINARRWAKHVESNANWVTKQVEGGVRIWRIS
jgi:hypothetical protein